MTDKIVNIAKLLYAAYPHADLLPIDPAKDCRDLNTLLAKVTEEEIGDSLFRFMVVEMVEGGESSLSGAVRVLARARDDVQAVLEALYAAQNPQTQHLYEVQATEYNGCQEYAQSKLLTAESIVDAIKEARAYFQDWYDDGEDPQEHRTNDPDVFVFNGGAIRLVIRSIQKITLGDWVRVQLELHGVNPILDDWMPTSSSIRAARLLEAFKTVLCYTSELLHQLDNQVNLDEIEELRQAKAAIAQYESKDASEDSQQIELTLKELSPEHPKATIPMHLLCEHGKLWIRPNGYGDACSEDGHGFPIALELWQGRLRLVVFSDINNEEPKILDLEKAREACRIEGTQEGGVSSYCAAIEYLSEQGRKIFTGHMNGGLWNARCLDACILSKKQCDKVVYEFLLKFGDQYAQGLAADSQDTWQKIKESAAAMLNA